MRCDAIFTALVKLQSLHCSSLTCFQAILWIVVSLVYYIELFHRRKKNQIQTTAATTKTELQDIFVAKP